jgi:hypothetical protein
LTVILLVRFGLQVQAINSPPFAAFQKEGKPKPKTSIASFSAAVNEKSYNKPMGVRM